MMRKKEIVKRAGEETRVNRKNPHRPRTTDTRTARTRSDLF
ncbi:unnamed protein product, partial [marine sediment metagenome]